VKTTIYTTDMNESRAIGCAAAVLASLPRTGPIAAMSLRVERDGATSLVLHLESGEDVSVRRGGGETWAQAIDRFNAERSETVDEESERRRGNVPPAEGPIEEMLRGM
jgi:hypothetical protein